MNKKNIYIVVLLFCAFFIFALIINSIPNDAEYLYPKSISNSEVFKTRNIVFEDKTLQAGLLVSHKSFDQKISDISDVLGSSSCVIDFNKDGFDDLLILNDSGQNRLYGKKHWWHDTNAISLYENLHGREFKLFDLPESILSIKGVYSCAISDLDLNGFEDIVIGTLTKNYILSQKSHSQFELIELEGKTAWTMAISIVDVNNDGFDDLYFTNYLKFNKNIKTYESHYGYKNSKKHLNATLFDTESNLLLLNQGSFKFDTLKKEKSIASKDIRGLSSYWYDFNDDDELDLYNAGDVGTGSKLFIKQGSKGFEADRHFMATDPSKSVRSFSAYYDGYIQKIKFIIATGENGTLSLAEHQESFPYYSEDTLVSLSTYGRSSWRSAISDFNHDGFIDIYSPSGFLDQDPSSEFNTLAQPNDLFVGQENNTFNIVKNYSPSETHFSSRFSNVIDFNLDGKDDIFVSNNNSIGELLVNKTLVKDNWLGLIPINENNIGIRSYKVNVYHEKKLIRKFIKIGGGGSFDKRSATLVNLPHCSDLKVEIIINNNITEYHDLTCGSYWLLKKDKKRKLNRNKPTLKQYGYYALLLAIENYNVTNRAVILDILEQGNVNLDEQALLLAKRHLPQELYIRLAAYFLSSHNYSDINQDNIINLFDFDGLYRWINYRLKSHSPALSCQAASIVKQFFYEEESFQNSKGLFLDTFLFLASKPEIAPCLINTMTEIPSWRIVSSLKNIELEKYNNEQIREIISVFLKQKDLRILPLLKRILQSNQFEIPERINSLYALYTLSENEFKESINSLIKNKSITNNLIIDGLFEKNISSTFKVFLIKKLIIKLLILNHY